MKSYTLGGLNIPCNLTGGEAIEHFKYFELHVYTYNNIASFNQFRIPSLFYICAKSFLSMQWYHPLTACTSLINAISFVLRL